MEMKKKILSLLLIGIIIISLTGCGNNNSSNVNTSSNDNNTTKNENATTTDNEKKDENVKEDNQDLVETLNNVVNEFISEAEKDEDGYYSLSALFKIYDRLRENGIYNYEFRALCDAEFTEKVELEEFAYKEEMIPNYKGKCTYDTWNFDKEENNKGDDRYVLVLDTNTNDYYSVKITFKKRKFGKYTKYYPIFSNSKLLK